MPQLEKKFSYLCENVTFLKQPNFPWDIWKNNSLLNVGFAVKIIFMQCIQPMLHFQKKEIMIVVIVMKVHQRI